MLIGRKILILAAFMTFCVSGVIAQTSAFTYQGKLSNSGIAANGSYDIQFKIFDQETGGTELAAPWNAFNVTVANGVFTVLMNFDFPHFTSATASYIEIAVRPGSSTGTFTTLNPRQPFTSTPYAIRAASAATADNANAVGGTSANEIIKEGDARLTDSRAPTPGSSNYIQNGTTAQTANFNISGNGNVGGSFNATGSLSGSKLQFGGTDIMQANFSNASLFAGSATSVAGALNTVFGNQSFGSNTSGHFNSVFGANAMNSGQDVHSNSMFGAQSGTHLLGSRNTFLGSGSGFGLVQASNGTLLGFGSSMSEGLTHATAIGSGALVEQSNSIVLGSKGTNVGIGINAPAERLHVVGNELLEGNLTVTGNGQINGRLRTNGGIFIPNPNTVVITSPNGACWGITVNNSGVLSTFSTPCP